MRPGADPYRGLGWIAALLIGWVPVAVVVWLVLWALG